MSALPLSHWRALAQDGPLPELPVGLDAAWQKAVGWLGRLVPRQRRLLGAAQAVCDYRATRADLSDRRLRELLAEVRAPFRCARPDDATRQRALALICEAAHRTLGLGPHPVQVAGALGLASGCIVEMATGEGKTLTAGLAAILQGWGGHGCHVLTVNDYLAGRDADSLGPLYRFCGLTVGLVNEEKEPAERREAYLADVTYSTNKEVAADFLRDRLTLGATRGLAASLLRSQREGRDLAGELVQRGLACAIVDEADSVLIDEAVTPLIISGEAPNATQVDAFLTARDLAGTLRCDRDYRIDEQYHEVRLTAAGCRRLEKGADNLTGIWSGPRRREELVVQALVAKHLFHRDTHYLVDEEKVVIIDESTGRLMPDRTWRDGLHQAIEAKEDLTVNPPKATYARVSFQRFFRLYSRLCGMTGTAAEARSEFWQTYELPFVAIPTHRPCRRVLAAPRIHRSLDAKWEAVTREVAQRHEARQPVLIGTRSVAASQAVSRRLEEAGLPHRVLNAVHHRQEAEIVAAAGTPGAITVATNMAGRGTDIRLGRGVADLGGLHVLATERHETARIDRQLFGRASRQGDPGSGQAFLSLEDPLLARYAAGLVPVLRRIAALCPPAWRDRVLLFAYGWAEWRAERMARRQRGGVARADRWLDEFLGFAGREI